jgi:hypothetical protein
MSDFPGRGAIILLASQPFSHRSLLSLVALTVCLWSAKYHPFLAAPRVIDDDARQHVYWTYRFQDPDLFPNDLLTDFISSYQVAPPGYQMLYAIGARLMDPLLFSQLLSLGLLMVSVWLLWCIGQQMGGAYANTFAAGLLLLYVLYSSSGGLPKSFGFPLLLSGVLLALRRAFGGLAGLCVVQSLLYPPMLLNTGALAAVTWLRAWRYSTGKAIWWSLGMLGVGVGVAALVLGNVYGTTATAPFGPMVTRSLAAAMPEFAAQGRTAFYGETWWQTLLNDRGGIGAARLYGFIIILGIMEMVRWPARFVVPAVVTDLVWTSLILFGLAHAVLFKLHLPSRYVLYTLPTAAIVLIAANGAGTCRLLQLRWPLLGHTLRRLRFQRRVWWASAVVLVLAFMYVQNRYIVVIDPLTIRIDRQALHVYRHLQTLPKDVVIAGHPWEMDNIPLFAHRKVLVNQELSLPYFTGYYAEVRQRLLDSLIAYYAADAQQVQQFVQRYGVDYILLNTQHFTPEFLQERIYYEPFKSLVRARLTASPRFALLEAVAGERVYIQEPYILVSFAHRKKGRDGGAAH